MTLDQWLIREQLTNAEFGRRIGLSEASISRIRRGEQDPSADTARLIVAETNNAVTHNELFGRRHA